MTETPSYVVSDLHVGNDHCAHTDILAWIDSLPARADLILNGDIVDQPWAPLKLAHRAVLDRLVTESRRRRVIWVTGNHGDPRGALADTGNIRFEERWSIGDRLLVIHGHELDDVRDRHKIVGSLYVCSYKILVASHKILVALGVLNVHLAQYAKKWGVLHRLMNHRVAKQALREARSLGYSTITCGHTHTPMDVEDASGRYINTGAWTEEPHHYLVVDGESLELRVFRRQ